LATSLSYYRRQKNNENTTKKKAITSFLLSVTLLKLKETEPFKMYLLRAIEELSALPRETQSLVFSKIEEYLGDDVMRELCQTSNTFDGLYKQYKLQKKETEESSEISIIKSLYKSAKKILERKKEIAPSLPQIPKERKKTLESPFISLKSWECDNPEIKYDEGLFLFNSKKHAASNQHLIPLYETIRTSLGHTIYFLGVNFGAIDDLDNAIRCYKKNKIILSKRNPSHKEALLATLAQLGICYYRKNDIPKATETLKEAALIISTLDASHAIPAKDIRNIYDYLGRCYLKNKESNASITCFKSAKKYSENSEDKMLINRQIMDAMLASKKSDPEVEHHSGLRRVKSALL
jgi:tetratricopeptide (TPR) repeat protein